MAAKKAAPKKAAAPESGGLDATIFVPRGQVRRDEILRTALLLVRDEIPPAAMNVRAVVASASDVRTDEAGTEGRDYVVAITWEPRRVGVLGEEETPPPGLDETIESLEPLTAAKIAEATDTGKGSTA